MEKNDITSSALRIELRTDGVAVVWIDVPGDSVNTLKADFADDFARAFADLDARSDVKAVVLASAKRTGFIVGADVNMLSAVKTAGEAQKLARTGQIALNALASSKRPIVAAIDGPALGGGLEVALACHARVASDDAKTKLGLPEVQLGLLPGAGGTQRLPRLVSIESALDMLLTGKQLSAKRAKSIGLVDEVVPRDVLIAAAAKRALSLVGAPPAETFKLDLAGLGSRFLKGTPVGRSFVFGQAKKALLEKTHGNYPAPQKILEVVRIGLERGFDEGLAAEAEAFGTLVVSPEARALMSIFFATTALKKDRGTDAAVEPRPVAQVAMLGAGLMGAGIAYVTASQAELPVRLLDKDAAGVAKGLGHVRQLVETKKKRRRITEQRAKDERARVTGAADLSGLAQVDVVIEAVFEDLGLKHRMLREIESRTRPTTIFASNTSSLPISEIAKASAHPETVVGMHYFSPVDKMPLLEIIAHATTSPEVIATVVELGKKQGKTVIVVNDGVGFYTSRILGPMMNEAAYLLAEGLTIESIDEAMVQYGFPVGPITLLDEVGIDVAEKVGHIVYEAFGERMRPPPGFEKLLADGRQGKKNKKGFYRYADDAKKKGKKEVDASVYAVLGLTPGKKTLPAAEIAERCTLAMVNEACLCYGEGILRSARDGDIGAIFGLGFPPFRGGPFRLVDALGPKDVVRTLERLRDSLGIRFAPAPVLVDLASQGRTFHGADTIPPGRHPRPARVPS